MLIPEPAPSGLSHTRGPGGASRTRTHIYLRHIRDLTLKESLMESAAHIEKRIVELREKLRCTLDRTALPPIREQLMAEIVKLRELNGTNPAERPTRQNT